MALTQQQIDYALKQIGFSSSTAPENAGAAAVARRRQMAAEYDKGLEDQKSYPQKVLSNLKNTFIQGAQKVKQDINSTSDTANQISSQGNNPGVVEKVLAAGKTAGNLAGDVAATTGGLISSFIEPLLSDKIKSKLGGAVNFIDQQVDSIPGMTPEIKQALGDVFNTVTLKAGNEGSQVTKEAGLSAGAKVAEMGGEAAAKAKQVTKKVTAPIGAKIAQKVEDLGGIDEPTKAILDPALNAQKKLTDTAKIKQIGTNYKAKAATVAEKTNSYLKQAKKAAIDYTQPTPLELAGSKAETALEVLNKKLTSYGQAKSKALEKVAGQTVPGVDDIKMSLLEGLDKRVGAYIDETGNIANAPGKVSKIALDPADQKLLKDSYDLINKLGDSDTVLKIDGTIDALQDLLYKRSSNLAIPVNGSVEALMKEITGKLNSLVKRKAGATYTQNNLKYANVIDLRDKLNKALGLDANKGGALMKRVFSPSDAGTKNLFNKIKDITGIDLTEEAVLAKVAMEAVGDTRSANLLEQLGVIKGALSSGGSLGKIERIAQYLIKKAASKEKTVKKILDRAKNR